MILSYRRFRFAIQRDIYRGEGWTVFVAFGFTPEKACPGSIVPCRLAIELYVRNPFRLYVRRDGKTIDRK